MARASRRRRLQDLYAFPGFRPLATVHGVFGDRKARLIKLVRRAKKRAAEAAVRCIARGTTARSVVYAISPVVARGYICSWRCGAFDAGVAWP